MRLRTADARQAKPQRGFILTDPPYWSREGRKVAIDDWLKPAFAENYRGLPQPALCEVLRLARSRKCRFGN